MLMVLTRAAAVDELLVLTELLELDELLEELVEMELVLTDELLDETELLELDSSSSTDPAKSKLSNHPSIAVRLTPPRCSCR